VILAVISDTHLPRGNRQLPDACVERLRGADAILHCGDFFELSVLRALELHGQVAAVHGNVDDAEVRQLLPSARLVEIDDSDTLIPLDQPARFAQAIREFAA
jgi:putative phosphoesterase